MESNEAAAQVILRFNGFFLHGLALAIRLSSPEGRVRSQLDEFTGIQPGIGLRNLVGTKSLSGGSGNDIGFQVLIDPGSATSEDIAAVLEAISELNRAAGGIGKRGYVRLSLIDVDALRGFDFQIIWREILSAI
jgi:hypothetical protein